jgi:general secretion pathway protein A
MYDVYKACYLFRDHPFRLNPDHTFSFSHPSYDNARAYLRYGISSGEGFVAITGGPGTGKTTLLNQLVAELDSSRISVGRLSTPLLETGNLVRMVIRTFAPKQRTGDNSDPLLQLERFLQVQAKKDRRTILIVDEAQGLSPDSLEALRVLTNLQSGDRLMLQVFLAGHQRLLDMIRAPGMEQLRQRLVAAAHLEPLDADEAIAYVEHRLRQVGWKNDPTIHTAALRLIHSFSGGIPRLINLISHRLFLYGGLHAKHVLDEQDARHVIEELGNEGLLGGGVGRSESSDYDSAAQAKDLDAGVRSLRPVSF